MNTECASPGVTPSLSLEVGGRVSSLDHSLYSLPAQPEEGLMPGAVEGGDGTRHQPSVVPQIHILSRSVEEKERQRLVGDVAAHAVVAGVEDASVLAHAVAVDPFVGYAKDATREDRRQHAPVGGEEGLNDAARLAPPRGVLVDRKRQAAKGGELSGGRRVGGSDDVVGSKREGVQTLLLPTGDQEHGERQGNHEREQQKGKLESGHTVAPEALAQLGSD